MEPKVFPNRNSLAGSAAREAEGARTAASGLRIEPGSAARAAADPETPRRWQNDEGHRINLRAQPARQPPPRLFPGPSARPVATAPVVTADPVVTPDQQAPYSPTPQPETVTSLGGRFQNALRALFT